MTSLGATVDSLAPSADFRSERGSRRRLNSQIGLTFPNCHRNDGRPACSWTHLGGLPRVRSGSHSKPPGPSFLFPPVRRWRRAARDSRVEAIVVDDGSTVPVAPQSLPPNIATTLLRLEGVDPRPHAMQAWRPLRGDIVLFTDDDTVPFAAWIPAAVMYLDSHPEAVGVTGPIRSVAWDPLYEQSIEADAAGHQWTCNIGYRRSSVLVALRGFVLRRLPMLTPRIGISDSRDGRRHHRVRRRMEVAHTPRPISLRAVVRQARWASDDLTSVRASPPANQRFYPADEAGASRRCRQKTARRRNAPTVRNGRRHDFCAAPASASRLR